MVDDRSTAGEDGGDGSRSRLCRGASVRGNRAVGFILDSEPPGQLSELSDTDMKLPRKKTRRSAR